MAVLIQLSFDVGNADQASAAVRAVHQEVARLNLATTAGAGSVGNFRSQVTQTGTASLMAGQHMHMLRGALISLAQQGTGTTGVMGRLAAGLLQFGAGSAVVVGVAAGIAVLGLAYKQFTADTEKAKKAQEEFVKELAKVGPFAAQRATIFSKQQELADLQARLAAVQAPQTLAQRKEFSPEAREAAIIEIQSKIATVQSDLVRFGTQLTEDIAAKLKPLIPLVPQAGALAFNQFEDQRLGLRGQITLRRTSFGNIFQGGQPELATGGAKFQGYEPPTPKDLTPIVAASFSAIAAVAGGGGAGAAMSALGALVATLPGGGLAGTIVSGFGALFGLFGGGGMPVKVTNFKDLEGIQQPARTELLIVDSSGRSIERLQYDIGRRDARDITPRLPVMAGA